MPIEEFQLLAVTPTNFMHTIRTVNGPWYRFGDVRAATHSTAPTILDSAACAGIGDQLHVCVTSFYRLFHCIRNGDGTWTNFSDVAPVAQLTGQVVLPACASVGGELHVTVVAGSGLKLWHSIRHANGTWTRFGDVFHETGTLQAGILSQAAAEVAGELHLCVIDGNQQLWHTTRHADGTWDKFDNVNDSTALPAKPSFVTMAGVNGELQVVFTDYGFIGGVGGLWHAIRHPDRTWTAFGNVKGGAGDKGSVRQLSACEVQGELHLITISDATPDLWHTIRYANGAWQQFGNVEYAVTGQSGRFIFSMIAAAGALQGTYRPPSPSAPAGGTGPGTGCFPGVAGASAVVMFNGVSDTQSIWSLDLMTGVPTYVGDIDQGESVEVALTDCHYSRVIAVDQAWVDDYNQTFDTDFDAHTWETANTVNFERSSSTILGRSAGGTVVVSVL